MKDRTEYIRDWAARNRDKRNASQRKWYAKHTEKAKAAARNWIQRNIDKVRAMQRAWRAANTGLQAAQINRRRERKIGVESCDEVSSCVLAQLISSCARMRCGICGKNMPKNDRTIDHVIPLSKGGTGHIGNLQVVHLSCNCSKNCKTPDQLTGQHEMNFAGNRAHLNNPKKENNGVTLDSTLQRQQETINLESVGLPISQ